MTNFFKKNNNKKAFSMIEIAVVIIVIGIMIAAALWVSNFLLKKSRILSAQSLTKSSPIYGIKDSMLWLESSLDKSFKDDESSEANPLSIWYDNRESTNKNNAIQNNSSNFPTYANSINHIQAVEFDGVNSYFTISDASFLNNINYTIFILEKRKSDKSNNYFIGDISSSNQSQSNKNLVLGYKDDSSIIHSQSSGNNYKSSISNYASSQEKPRIFTFIHSNIAGKSLYINGLLAATSSDKSSLQNITSLAIGKSYQGEIGEIAIFIRDLKPEERISVEDYLGKKWNVEILRGNSQSSCVGGKVTPTGCQNTCSVLVNGSNVTEVASGETQVACNAGGNYDTTPFTFSACSGSPISGSCSCKVGYTGSNCSSCDTANNYQMISGTCQKTCVVPADSGTTETYVVSGSTSTSCNADGYYSGTMSYTCDANGNFNITTPCIKKPVCTGGAPDTTSVAGKTIHKFTTTGTSNFRCTVGGTLDYLIVAGGGGGGGRLGGGGGAGGLLTGTISITSNTDYEVKVGAGGNAGSHSNWGTNGGNSSIGASLTAIGGGSGGSSGGWWNGNNLGKDGGSGGGGSVNNLNGTSVSGGVPAGNGTSGQGNKGAKNPSAGGGGGGAGAAAVNGSRTGAIGSSSSITGTATYYAGGGGGGGYSVNASGGLGGGGTGGSNSTIACTDGTNNTGGGGGGGSLNLNSSKGCKGGSGIVIISY